MNAIELIGVEKYFKVLNRREGLLGSFKDLFSADYKTIKAVDGVSLTIKQGEIVGYLGPNGAGKSTTIKMMTGILKPSGGQLLVNGRVPYENRKLNAQTLGIVFGQRTQLWWDLPVIESFHVFKEIYKIPDDVFAHNMKRFEELAGIDKLYNQPVRSLSLGQRMLCDIAASFLHNPQIVFLDEPTIGLDVAIKSRIRNMIRELNEEQNVTIILTTHDIGDVEALCSRVVIIDKGKKIFDDDTERVKELFGTYRELHLEFTNPADAVLETIASTLAQQFPIDDPIVATEGVEKGWVKLTVNQSQAPFFDVLQYLMKKYDLNDVKTAEVSTESVIQRIYDGGLS